MNASDLRSFPKISQVAALIFLTATTWIASPVLSAVPEFRFPSIDGGEIDLKAWRGGPVLVVNTASLCGFVGQFDGLQALHDQYSARGLHVLAVPSDDFAQELDSAAEVKSFCTTTYDLTLPMTDILHVRGAEAHPFYGWLAATNGFVPQWNFNKVLIGPDGAVLATWGARTEPLSPEITGRIEALLP
jgi:glutathione peroxidase